MEKKHQIRMGKDKMKSLADDIKKQRKAVAKNAMARDVVQLSLDVMVERVVDCRDAILEALSARGGGKKERLLDVIGSEVERVAEDCLSVPRYHPEGRTQQEVFLFVGTHWRKLENEKFFEMLKRCCQRMGVPKEKVNYHAFMQDVFCSVLLRLAHCWKPPVRPEGVAWMNLQNGTLEVDASGVPRLREHRKEDYMVNCLPFCYDASAECPLWLEFLERVLPDVERQHVVRQYVANALMGGPVRIDKMLILKGGGSNGKSVFLDVLGALAGRENVSNISLNSLTNELFMLPEFEHKLLNISSESESKWGVAVMKQLTSHEPVVVRAMYKDPHTMTEYGYLIAAVNELPRAEATDAFFRRLQIVGFDATITYKEADPDLANKLKQQLPGILNWFLSGLPILLERKRLPDCSACEEELRNYRENTDYVGLFCQECCQPTNEWVMGNQLYKRFVEFCADCGLKSMTSPRFYEKLSNMRVKRTKKHNQWAFQLALL